MAITPSIRGRSPRQYTIPPDCIYALNEIKSQNKSFRSCSILLPVQIERPSFERIQRVLRPNRVNFRPQGISLKQNIAQVRRKRIRYLLVIKGVSTFSITSSYRFVSSGSTAIPLMPNPTSRSSWSRTKATCCVQVRIGAVKNDQPRKSSAVTTKLVDASRTAWIARVPVRYESPRMLHFRRSSSKRTDTASNRLFPCA